MSAPSARRVFPLLAVSTVLLVAALAASPLAAQAQESLGGTGAADSAGAAGAERPGNDKTVSDKTLVDATAAAAEAEAAKAAASRAKGAAVLKANESTARAVVSNYAVLVHSTYADLAKSTQALLKAVGAFVKAPTAATHAKAKDAWKASRKIYGLTEAFRFYGGPIDDPKTGPEGFMNAWPLDEAYIDSVRNNAGAGYVNDAKAFPEITRESLLSLNEKDGEKNISTGYHAIEFLLWGQDFNPKGAGRRTFSEYVDSGSNNATRRARALTLLAELLDEQVRGLEAQWKPGSTGTYVESFLALPPSESVQKILAGVATLSVDELAGERMTVALAKNDEENEQSCFSDTTTNDFVANARGIENIWTGRYGAAKGPGLRALIAKTDGALAPKLTERLSGTVSLMKAIPAPFDAVIASAKESRGRKTAEKAIESSEIQGKLFARAAKSVGVEINVQE